MLRSYFAIQAGCWAVMLFGGMAVGEEPVHPAVDAFFRGEDPFIKDTVLPNIEKYRKSNITLATSDVKLHVSEFGIREGTIQYADRLEPDWSASNRDQPDENDGPQWTEERKAEYFVQTIVTCFSHPAVRAFNLWGMGPGNMFMDGNRLIEEDYSPRPTYHALRYLIKDKLRTRESGTTSPDGGFKFRGFHGLYRVIITTADGKVTESKFTLTPDNPRIAILCSDTD